MYIDTELPGPYTAEWSSERYLEGVSGTERLTAKAGELTPIVSRARAAYFGLLTHIDYQFHRVVKYLKDQGKWENTFVLFTSDHGELLGDHYQWHKSKAWEGSARVPFVIKADEATSVKCGQVVDDPVGLEDIMPTLLDVAGVDIPESVEGRSVLPLLRNEDPEWRPYYHGEYNGNGDEDMQFLVDESMKYVWFSTTGEEFLFDLDSDPGETENIATGTQFESTAERWRSRLVDELEQRPEGFVEGGDLVTASSN